MCLSRAIDFFLAAVLDPPAASSTPIVRFYGRAYHRLPRTKGTQAAISRSATKIKRKHIPPYELVLVLVLTSTCTCRRSPVLGEELDVEEGWIRTATRQSKIL